MTRWQTWGVSVAFLGAGVLFAAGPADAAATANFQGKCSWNGTFTQFTCTFDAQRPASAPSACPGSFIWKYQWEVDDGTGTGLTGQSTYTRTFPAGSNPAITLTVFCWNGEFPSTLRFVCSNIGIPYCIQVPSSWS